jgi:uncharacterized membrane protein
LLSAATPLLPLDHATTVVIDYHQHLYNPPAGGNHLGSATTVSTLELPHILTSEYETNDLARSLPMAPLLCLIVSFLFFRILGLEWGYFANWHFALRAALGAMFLLTASAHWGKRRADLIRMVPASLGTSGVWVTLTGIAEVAIAVGLQIGNLAPWVAGIAVVMLCCLFPANMKAVREHLTILRKPVLSVGPRLLIQLVFIAALIASVWSRR